LLDEANGNMLEPSLPEEANTELLTACRLKSRDNNRPEQRRIVGPVIWKPPTGKSAMRINMADLIRGFAFVDELQETLTPLVME
jgi:hypothetical protein